MIIQFTPEFMKQQREMVDKATDLPWEAIKLNADGAIIRVSGYEIHTPPYDVAAHTTHQPPIRKEADALYIEAAANNYPAALDEIERLQQVNAALLKAAYVLYEERLVEFANLVHEHPGGSVMDLFDRVFPEVRAAIEKVEGQP
jgi:hypothetical protein